ncbi:hypothetical protein AC1031_004938 [Aphanomyces cochlioides]|nr:hypothetical protein AC1031_004938 [Aphanomyces cochlioides]
MAHAEQVKLKQKQARAAIQSLEATKEALLTRRELKRRVRWNWFVIFSMEDGELLQRWAEEVAEWSCKSDDNWSNALLQLREHSEQASHDEGRMDANAFRGTSWLSLKAWSETNAVS